MQINPIPHLAGTVAPHLAVVSIFAPKHASTCLAHTQSLLEALHRLAPNLTHLHLNLHVVPTLAHHNIHIHATEHQLTPSSLTLRACWSALNPDLTTIDAFLVQLGVCAIPRLSVTEMNDPTGILGRILDATQALCQFELHLHHLGSSLHMCRHRALEHVILHIPDIIAASAWLRAGSSILAFLDSCPPLKHVTFVVAAPHSATFCCADDWRFIRQCTTLSPRITFVLLHQPSHHPDDLRQYESSFQRLLFGAGLQIETDLRPSGSLSLIYPGR
ncbi:hypothetical protein DFH09DRAFT_1314190 [Mycena vulgaris]|nr:hypothetical protein DFH09DRAFT_1314190 [Mycena vulgaris]